MRKLIATLVLVALVTLSLNAQEKKWEASASGIYGQFTEEFTKEVYPSIKGFEIEVSRLIYKNWLGAGIYYEALSSSGEPVDYGYVGVDESADVNMNTLGIEVFVRPFKFIDIYTRYGALTFKEILDSNIGEANTKEKGSTWDFGARFNISIGKDLNLQVKAETTSMNLKDIDLDGAADNVSVGLGLGYRF